MRDEAGDVVQRMALLDDGVIAIERSSLNIPRSRFSDEILSFITMRELLGRYEFEIGWDGAGRGFQ